MSESNDWDEAACNENNSFKMLPSYMPKITRTEYVSFIIGVIQPAVTLIGVLLNAVFFAAVYHEKSLRTAPQHLPTWPIWHSPMCSIWCTPVSFPSCKDYPLHCTKIFPILVDFSACLIVFSSCSLILLRCS